jgi:tight adherence protein C
MTLLLFVVSIGLVAITARLVARAIAVPRLQLKAHLREIRDYGFEGQITETTTSGRERLQARVRRLAHRLGDGLMNAVPSLSALSRGDIAAAGYYELTPEALHGYRAMAAVGLPAIIGLLLAAGGHVSGLGIVLVLVSAAAGWILPSATIRRRGSSRLEEIDHRLPELIDVLIATVEAGMAFSAAMGMVAERFTGPIGEELKLAMKQQTLGMSMQQALTEIAERCDTPSMRAFVRTAGRGETLGVSIGPVLRELSSDQRRRHRMAAREKMQKAPVKMIFPLMFLIFPALMIVLMYPAFYSVSTNLSGVFGH